MDIGNLFFIGFGLLFVIFMFFLVFYWSKKQKQALENIAEALGTDKISSGYTYKGELDGLIYYYQYYAGSKNNPSYFHVWVNCDSSGEFSISTEGKFDQFFKKLGIAVEIQTGDESFDNDFYIHTDSIAFTTQYFMNYDKRVSVRNLFELGYNSVEHDGNNMKVKLSPCSLEKLSDIGFIENAVRKLNKLSLKLPSGTIEPIVMGAPAWKAKRNFLYCVTGLSLLIGFGAIIWGLSAFTPLDGFDIFLYGLEFAVPAFILFLVLSVIFLKGRSSSHKELMIVSFLALLGFPMVAFGGLTVLNGYLDQSNQQAHDVKTYSKRYSKSKNSTNYYVTVESWRPDRSDEEIKIKSSTYNRIKSGQSIIRIITQQGSFNYEWIVSYRVLKSNKKKNSES